MNAKKRQSVDHEEETISKFKEHPNHLVIQFNTSSDSIEILQVYPGDTVAAGLSPPCEQQGCRPIDN
jgi:hypothetical protein